MAGMVLADAGARVLKVEPPEGDRLRTHVESGLPGVEPREGERRRRPPHGGGPAAGAGSRGDADVVIEAFSPGIGRGVGHRRRPALRRQPPTRALRDHRLRLDGPVRPRSRATTPWWPRRSGLFSRGAFGPREGPIHYPVPWASYGAGMQAVAGILGALLVRDQTGRGQRLDATLVAGLDPIDYFVSTIVQLWARRARRRSSTPGARSVRVGTACWSPPRTAASSRPRRCSPTKVRPSASVAGIGDALDDPRFANLPMFDTAEDAQDWEDMLWEAFRQEDLAHWRPLLEASPDVAFEIGGDQRGGARPPADRAQRRRDHRHRPVPWSDSPGRPDRALRRDTVS